ncbi:M14 family zinc carboxypeptidase [Neobacillus sp. SM06]|uniref:M14 family zinc carboxypeptidase n=1 Tax=Neobacillus sp. SM06 TaxID=3422492 RepID=UPI003D2C800A
MRFQPVCVKNSSPCDSMWLDQCILNLEKTYPFITRCSIGTSVLGKPLWEIQIGNGPKKIHMNGSFHANEWITSVVLLNLLERYLFLVAHGLPFMGFPAVDLYRQTSLSIVPMVNPDGVDLVLNGPPDQYRDAVLAINEGSDEFVHWKANLLGVDLNKQYPANWEIDQKRKAPDRTCPSRLPGESTIDRAGIDCHG